MSHNSRLSWIQTNRTRVDRAQQAGAPIGRLVERVAGTGAEAVYEVASAIAVFVDEEFRRHCRVVLADGGTVRIHVDVPAMVQPMRVRWLMPLGEALYGRGAGKRPRRIVFAYGTAGMGLATPHRTAQERQPQARP